MRGVNYVKYNFVNYIYITRQNAPPGAFCLLLGGAFCLNRYTLSKVSFEKCRTSHESFYVNLLIKEYKDINYIKENIITHQIKSCVKTFVYQHFCKKIAKNVKLKVTYDSDCFCIQK